MNNINYIGANELVYNSNKKDGIYSGGFSVNSTMLKLGLSPIITYNTQNGGNSNKVSDLFESLVIPNWALNYNNNIVGGEYKDSDEDDDYEENNTENFETEENDQVIDDDLHNKLLDLVIVKENEIKNQKNKIKNKKTRKQENRSTKKGGTKRKNK